MMVECMRYVLIVEVNNMNTTEMEVAISKYFGIRKHVIVPNVSWGLGLHECDLLILSNSNYATEVEIKISLADLKKDKEKRHGHRSKKIKYLYFAIPSKLAKHIEYIPLRAGVLVVNSKGKVFCIAKPVHNKGCRKFEQREVNKMLELGIMRTWKLKEKNVSHKKTIKQLKEKVWSY